MEGKNRFSQLSKPPKYWIQTMKKKERISVAEHEQNLKMEFDYND